MIFPSTDQSLNLNIYFTLNLIFFLYNNERNSDLTPKDLISHGFNFYGTLQILPTKNYFKKSIFFRI